MEPTPDVPTPRDPALPVPAHALQAAAAHARCGGGCLLLLAPDGAVLWHDADCPGFHQDYLLPLLRDGGPVAALLAARAKALPAEDAIHVWDDVPALLLAAAPLVQRRQTAAILLVAARDAAFQNGAHFEQLCIQAGDEPAILAREARKLAGWDPARLRSWADLLKGVLADRQHLRTLEAELNGLSSHLANAYEELTLIEQVGGGMRVNRGIADFFQQACVDVAQVMGVRAMGVALDPAKCEEAPAIYGEVTLAPAQLRRLADHLLACLRKRQSWMLANNLAEDPSLQWLAPVARRLIAVPLLRGEQVLGCVFGLDKATGEFDSVDAKLLASIAGASAIYLENALLFGNLHDLMMGLLHSLTSAVDAKDAYTCGHSERVALLARDLAVRVGLDDAQVEQVYMAGLLHDVGKIGVPESVLQKNGRLTPEEFDLIKKHPSIGARILSDVRQLEDIVPGVLHHHERFDGRGYPAGLAGRDIPLIGRIICLADCFDAMTSSRTYRKALPLEVALAEIRRCAGTQFDPALAEVFLRTTPEQFQSLLRDHQKQAKRLLDLQEMLRAA